jgi:signal transduction histidine kinase/CheY-like chemotaxis protein
MKSKIIIFIILNVFGFILATLGTISSPIFWSSTFFWPAAVLEAVEAILFGWTGILAGTIFPIFANLVTGQTYTSILFLTPGNFLQGYLAFYLFRKLNCDINLKGIKSILFFSLIVAFMPQFCGGIVYSSILLFVGEIANIYGIFELTFLWSMNLPWIIIFGIPLIKIFVPILKDYGFLFGEPKINKTSIDKKGKSGFKNLPIFLKIFSSLLLVGVIPVSVMGAYEIIISQADTATLNINAIFICFGLFATLILTGMLTNAVISPIKKLSHGIGRIAAGDFDYKVEAYNDDELGRLAVTFNNMSKMLKDNIQQREIYAKLAAIGETTSLVAHDVRKPFIMLKMMLQMLPTLTPEQTKNYSKDLDISIHKVDAMLSDIMEASREMKYELVPGNILAVLNLAIKNVSRCHSNKKVDFYYNYDTIPLIDIDEQRMCRAFENIIDNAFDCLPRRKGFMWFSVKEEEKTAKIIIGNSHSCISEDKIKKIFQNRFTAGKKGGTGLGLSIVTKVVNGHNGSIIVRNVQTAPYFVPKDIRNIQGVEFEAFLPLTEKSGYRLRDPLFKSSEEAKAKLGMIQKKNQLARSSEIDVLIEKLELLKQKPNLLILDDESIYRKRIRDVLENIGELNKLIHIYDAGGYKETIDVLSHTKIDYLICDIDLSDKKNDGFSVLSKTLEKYPSCMVLIHTNRKEPEDVNKARALGACGFCPKPITEAILVDLLLNKKLWSGVLKEPEKKGEHC